MKKIIFFLIYIIIVAGLIVAWIRIDDISEQRKLKQETKISSKLNEYPKIKNEFKEYEKFVLSIYKDKKLDEKEAEKLYEIKNSYDDYIDGSTDNLFVYTFSSPRFDVIIEDVKKIEDTGYSPLETSKLTDDTKSVFKKLDQYMNTRIQKLEEETEYAGSPIELMKIIICLLGAFVLISIINLLRPRNQSENN